MKKLISFLIAQGMMLSLATTALAWDVEDTLTDSQSSCGGAVYREDGPVSREIRFTYNQHRCGDAVYYG